MQGVQCSNLAAHSAHFLGCLILTRENLSFLSLRNFFSHSLGRLEFISLFSFWMRTFALSVWRPASFKRAQLN